MKIFSATLFAILKMKMSAVRAVSALMSKALELVAAFIIERENYNLLLVYISVLFYLLLCKGIFGIYHKVASSLFYRCSKTYSCK